MGSASASGLFGVDEKYTFYRLFVFEPCDEYCHEKIYNDGGGRDETVEESRDVYSTLVGRFENWYRDWMFMSDCM